MFSRRSLASLLVAGLAGLSAGFSAAPAMAQEKIRFAVTDVDGLESLQREFGPFKEAFEKISGLRVDFFPVSGRTAAVEAMNAGQVDFVLTGPAEYVVFNARLKAVPVVVWERPNYRSSIVVPDESPIRSLADLKGKKVSFGEIGSTSQHLAPATILADAGLGYAKDYEPVFLKLNVAAEALLRNDIAAIGMNQTHLERITKAFPNRKFRTLGDGANLPNDLIVASAKVKPEVVEAVRKTFRDHGPTLLAAITSTKENAKFIGGSFQYTVSDRDYDPVRKMFVNVGVREFTQFIGN
ncbi:MAG: phosphonate-binding protein [Methylobacterium sp.]|nr:MAG: phosphonate-binding protein [Methylobacterium sp.]